MTHAQSTLDSRPRELAGAWFLNSGIQETSGGIARYFHSDSRRNARISTEITGYGVSTFTFLYQRTENRDYLDAAIRAAQFLIRTAWSPSLKTFPFEHSHDGDAPQPLTYFFDCGIIIRGLLALWRVTDDAEYLEIASAAGESMMRDFAAGPDLHPILELPGKYPLQWGESWSRRPGCYQLKSALAWHDLHLITGHPTFSRSFSAALERALATEHEFLPAPTAEKTMDRLHAYCYFLEALTSAVDRPGVQSALVAGITRVSRYLRDIRREFERSDVSAQLLRVRLLAHQRAGLALNEAEAAEEASWIGSFQIENTRGHDDGGFWFGRKNGAFLPFINPVSTAFCLQAAEWWQDYQSGRRITEAVI